MAQNIDFLQKMLDIFKIKQDNLNKEREKLFKIDGYCDRLYNSGIIDGNKYYINKYNCECIPELKSLMNKISVNKAYIKYMSYEIDNIYDKERRNLLLG